MAKNKEEKKQNQKYVIADGVAITSLKGVLGPGKEVSMKDIPAKSFKAFVESGHIKKV
jgi:hypothetical protein